MTYREAIKYSLDKVEVGDTEIIPLSFPHFVLGIGAIMATQIAMKNEGINGITLAKKLSPLQFDLDSIAIGSYTHQFFTWLLEQPIPESEDGEIMWYDTAELQKQFNRCFFDKE